MSRRISRRQLLRGIGAGTALASIAPLHRAFAAGESACRFLFVLEGNCFEPRTMLAPSARAVLDDGATEGPVGTRRWWHRRYRHDSVLDVPSPDLADAPALGALRDVGLADQATAIFGLSSRVIGGGHSGYHGTLSSTRTLSGRAGGQTIDAYLSEVEAVRGDTAFEAIRMNVGGGALNFGACAQGRGLSLPLINDPQSAYNVLYGAFAGGEAERAFNHQSHLLDFLDADVQAAVADGRMSLSDVSKLGVYGAAVDALQLTQSRLSGMSVTPPTAPASGLSPIPRFGAILDLATSAMIDGLTNVAVVGSGVGGAFSLNYTSVSAVSRHDMHHGSAQSQTLRDAIAEVTRLQVVEIARVARRLADTPEPSGEGTMLDNTIIVFIGDNGEQHHSTATEFPVLLVGGGGLLAGGGRTLLYPGLSGTGHRQVSNLWNTLGHVAGRELNEFGGEDGRLRRAAGPLVELM